MTFSRHTHILGMHTHTYKDSLFPSWSESAGWPSEIVVFCYQFTLHISVLITYAAVAYQYHTASMIYRWLLSLVIITVFLNFCQEPWEKKKNTSLAALGLGLLLRPVMPVILAGNLHFWWAKNYLFWSNLYNFSPFWAILGNFGQKWGNFKILAKALFGIQICEICFRE